MEVVNGLNQECPSKAKHCQLGHQLVVLLGGGGIFRKQSTAEGSSFAGTMPVKDLVWPWPLPSLFHLPSHYEMSSSAILHAHQHTSASWQCPKNLITIKTLYTVTSKSSVNSRNCLQGFLVKNRKGQARTVDFNSALAVPFDLSPIGAHSPSEVMVSLELKVRMPLRGG